MQKTIKKKIGRETHTFIVEGDTLFDVMQEAGKLSFYDVHKCGICGGDHLTLGSHHAQNKYKYVTIKCKDCKASVNFGSQTENPDIFYIKMREEEGKDGKTKKVIDWNKFEPKGD